MSGKIKNCKGPFYVYHLINENYIGVTTKIVPRMQKHKSFGKNVEYKIIATFDEFNDALTFEYNKQIEYGFPTSKVKNQIGKNNPIAKKLIHTITGKKYETLKDACIDLGLNYGSMRHTKIQKKYNLIKL
jgi:predicted GIY-YIG superfamily endonuclease